MTVEIDGQGRLHIPKKVREKYGQTYHIVLCEDRIKLIPVSDDPLGAAREAAGELRDTPVEEIREDIEEEATTDIRETDSEDIAVERVPREPTDEE